MKGKYAQWPKSTVACKTEFWDKPVKGKNKHTDIIFNLLYHDIIPEEYIKGSNRFIESFKYRWSIRDMVQPDLWTKYVLESLSEYACPNKYLPS